MPTEYMVILLAVAALIVGALYLMTRRRRKKKKSAPPVRPAAPTNQTAGVGQWLSGGLISAAMAAIYGFVLYRLLLRRASAVI